MHESRADSTSGCLVLAATPLGDARDASLRLLDALANADLIAAEDTRRTRSLAAALNVTLTGRMVSFYDAVEATRIPSIIDAVRSGKTVLLVTDAGMPSVSDPGFSVVSACIAQDLPVTCLPGPSAVTTALALSGLAPDRFCFDGFVPRKPGERDRFLAGLVNELRTVVFFESPHRLAQTLLAAVRVLGEDRRAAICRELTKTYEEVRRGTLAELADWADGGVRGEITVVVAGASPPAIAVADLVSEVRDRVSAGERLKNAAAAVATANAVSSKELYDAVIASRKHIS